MTQITRKSSSAGSKVAGRCQRVQNLGHLRGFSSKIGLIPQILTLWWAVTALCISLSDFFLFLRHTNKLEALKAWLEALDPLYFAQCQGPGPVKLVKVLICQNHPKTFSRKPLSSCFLWVANVTNQRNIPSLRLRAHCEKRFLGAKLARTVENGCF